MNAANYKILENFDGFFSIAKSLRFQAIRQRILIRYLGFEIVTNIFFYAKCTSWILEKLRSKIKKYYFISIYFITMGWIVG